MTIRRRPSVQAVAAVSALGVALGFGAAVPGGPAQAAPAAPAPAPAAHDRAAGQGPAPLLHLPPDATYELGPRLAQALGVRTVKAADANKLGALIKDLTQTPVVGPSETPQPGAERLWPALDQTGRSGDPVIGVYLKQYELRAVGDNIEVWVADGADDVSTGTAFPAGDCRNDVSHSTDVTRAQAKGLAEQFDKRIYPRESKAFSVPAERDGTVSVGSGLLTAAGVDFRGAGDKIVTLVDNVRDDNFYEFPENRSYIAGFFTPIFNEITDRNVMTIDAFDWLHRTGADPKNQPAKDLCTSRPARPRLYEGTFAHEYQHLLMSYTDPAESIWVNEGLSDFASDLVGYSDATIGVDRVGADGHIYCFQGFGQVKGRGNPNPQACGGPENSLTVWMDEGTGSEVLADYGNAFSFMLYLLDRYGLDALSALHNDGAATSIDSVSRILDDVDKGTTFTDVLHDFQVMNLVDDIAGADGAQVKGISKDKVTAERLAASLNLDEKASFAKPGVAPNGADYLDLGAGKGLRSFDFTGARETLSGGDSGGEDVQNWNIRLVGIDTTGKRNRVLVKEYDDAFSLNLTAKQLSAWRSYPTVVAIVSHDDPRDTVVDYAPYDLEVNGKSEGR